MSNSHWNLERLRADRHKAERYLGIKVPVVQSGQGLSAEVLQSLALWLIAHEIVWASVGLFTGFWKPVAPGWSIYERMCTTAELGTVVGGDEDFYSSFPTVGSVLQAYPDEPWGKRISEWGVVSVTSNRVGVYEGFTLAFTADWNRIAY